MANFKNVVTLLTFVQNLVLSTVLAVVYSVTAVLYPKMTMELAKNDMESYKKTLTGAISSFLFIFIPASVGLILVRTPFLNLISGYGKVTQSDIKTAGIFLALYSLAFTTIALKELLDRAFFAAKNTKIPAVCGFITVFSNIVLSQIFIRFFGASGIPLAYSISSLCAVLFLVVKMQKNICSLGKETFKTFMISLISALLMGLVVYFTGGLFKGFDGFIGKVFNLFIPILAGGISYGLFSIIFKNPVALKVL